MEAGSGNPGTPCSSERTVTLESNLTANGAGCVISVSGASQQLHEGEWKCVTAYNDRFVDRITVTIDTGIAGGAFYSLTNLFVSAYDSGRLVIMKEG